VHRFELFKMKENETIAGIITQFTDITNSLVALEKDYTQVEKVRKVLRALTSDWEKKTAVIEEANDLSTLTLENLIGNLMVMKSNLKIVRRMNNNNQRRKFSPSMHFRMWKIQKIKKSLL